MSTFEDEIVLDSSNTRLHIIGKLKSTVEDKKLANHFSKNGVVAHPFSNYFIEGNKKNGLVMGYSSVNNKLIKETIAKMKQEYVAFLGQ